MSPVCLRWLWWERPELSVAEGAPAVAAGLMASGLWPVLDCSLRGDTLAVLCGCVSPSLLAELVQSKQECSEEPFSLCSVPQSVQWHSGQHAAALAPTSSPNSSPAGISFTSAAFECFWEMEDEACGANGWSRAQAGKQEEVCLCLTCPCLPGTMKRDHVVLRALCWCSGESCAVRAAPSSHCWRPVERKGASKSTAQGRAVKPDHYFRKEEKVSLTAFPVPKASYFYGNQCSRRLAVSLWSSGVD